MALSTRLTRIGVAAPLAVEIESQIETGEGNFRRLFELGFVAGDILAAGIDARSIKASDLAAKSTSTVIAKVIAQAVNDMEPVTPEEPEEG